MIPDLPTKERSHFRHFTTQNIRYGDLDRHDHVNNTAICSYVEDSRVQLRESLFPMEARDPNLSWMVVSFQIEFHAQLFYPGEVDVGTAIERLGNTSYALVHGVFYGTHCVATAKTITVLADRKTGKAFPIPANVRLALSSLGSR